MNSALPWEDVKLSQFVLPGGFLAVVRQAQIEPCDGVSLPRSSPKFRWNLGYPRSRDDCDCRKESVAQE